MMKTLHRRSATHCGLALATLLLGGCSLTAMLDSEKPEVRGQVSFNGTLKGDDASALYAKGKAHFAAGQFGLASDEFQAALAKKPGSVEILNALGATYDRLTRFDVADRYYKDALALDPKDPQTLNNLAYSLMLRGDPQHAIPLLNVAQSAAADPMIAANLALAKRLEKKLDQPAVADSAPSDKGNAPAPSQDVAAAAPDKPFWIERRSEKVQELVFAGGAKAEKTPAREWNLGSPALIVPLPPAPKAGKGTASNDVPEATVQVIPASYHSTPSKDDTDPPVAAPLIPVARSQVAELKPASSVSSAADEPKQIAETPPSAPPVQLVQTVPSDPVRLVERGSAEPATETRIVSPAPDHARLTAVQTASAEPTTQSATVSAPSSHARSIPVETAMAPAATLPASAPRKAALQSAESSRRSSACSIEISNGAGKTGMASRFRTFAEGHGLAVRRLTNDRSFSNARTVVYYRPGFEESARKLAALLSVPIAREPASAARCEVRLRLGHDLLSFDQRLQYRHPARTKS
jgi:hypothetical protein